MNSGKPAEDRASQIAALHGSLTQRAVISEPEPTDNSVGHTATMLDEAITAGVSRRIPLKQRVPNIADSVQRHQSAALQVPSQQLDPAQQGKVGQLLERRRDEVEQADVDELRQSAEQLYEEAERSVSQEYGDVKQSDKQRLDEIDRQIVEPCDESKLVQPCDRGKRRSMLKGVSLLRPTNDDESGTANNMTAENNASKKKERKRRAFANRLSSLMILSKAPAMTSGTLGSDYSNEHQTLKHRERRSLANVLLLRPPHLNEDEANDDKSTQSSSQLPEPDFGPPDLCSTLEKYIKDRLEVTTDREKQRFLMGYMNGLRRGGMITRFETKGKGKEKAPSR
ncbi:hypothetical protein DOTSEDRAFT_28427 [Dothistroma septosporum NZE10]|uniref:Uncharacterized protein n=1 Tax=Dothistroma septosporum (strain NZE10 / CBS 128990) TaxID=675120 RepID=M2WJX5_DOTSN|nr:hypothetical protein DOTSEDRAFT_28427 [Dothistroma septosporum NZE10]